MASSRIAARYSKSLFELSRANNQLEEVMSDMQVISDTCTQSRDLRNLLRNPIVKAETKKQVLRKVFSACSASTLDFISFVIEKKREAELPLIASQFLSAYDHLKGIARATVVSAMPLNEETMNKIRSYVKGMTGSEEIQLVNEVDQGIIGGIVIKHEDKLLDMSVARELREIRKELIYN